MNSAEIMLRRLFQAVDVVRLVDATLPIQTFAAFVAVALQQGQSISAIGEKVGISQSAASRNLSALSDWDYKKKVGLKLVEYRQDPMNLSIKTVHLTARGQNLVEHVVNQLQPESSETHTKEL